MRSPVPRAERHVHDFTSHACCRLPRNDYIPFRAVLPSDGARITAHGVGPAHTIGALIVDQGIVVGFREPEPLKAETGAIRGGSTISGGAVSGISA